MQIVVIGAAGSTRGHIVQQVVQAQHHVTALVRDTKRYQPPAERAVVHRADVLEPTSFERVLGGADAEVQRLRRERDVIVIGSISIVDTLRKHDLVDEYRLLVFPTLLAVGRRLCQSPVMPVDLRLVSAEQNAATALLRFERADQ